MSDDFATRVLRDFAALETVAAKTAVFVSRDGFRALINTGETTVSLPFVGMYLPPAGHPVQLELRAGQLVVTGPARPLPGVGKITTTGSPRATVTAWGIPYSLPFRSTYSPVVNDDVEITWSSEGGVIQGKVTATSNFVPPPAAAAPPLQTFQPAPFTCIDSASFTGSSWNSPDVWSSVSYVGAWFYGSKIKDTIPDTARIIAAAIYLNPRQISGDPPNLQLHTSPSRPGGTVAFTGTAFALPTRTGWVSIPTAFIDYLKSNDGGIGFNHGGYSIFRGRPSDQLSGALDIIWEA